MAVHVQLSIRDISTQQIPLLVVVLLSNVALRFGRLELQAWASSKIGCKLLAGSEDKVEGPDDVVLSSMIAMTPPPTGFSLAASRLKELRHPIENNHPLSTAPWWTPSAGAPEYPTNEHNSSSDSSVI